MSLGKPNNSQSLITAASSWVFFRHDAVIIVVGILVSIGIDTILGPNDASSKSDPYKMGKSGIESRIKAV